MMFGAFKSALRICLVLTVLAAGAAHAEWPEKAIRIVLPWPPGGGSDQVARAVGPSLAKKLGQPVVVDNKPGAVGAIGAQIAAHAPADGYTLLFASADTHTINPHVFSKLGYDAKADFEPIGIIGYLPFALIVRSDLPANSIPEFVKQAKSQPGKISFASWGVGSSSHVAMAMFSTGADFSLYHIPYTGAPAALLAVAAGQVDAMMLPISVAKAQAEGGKVKMLAVASPQRFAGTPSLPTFAEQGVPVDAGAWVGLLAPARTPPAIVRKINAALKDAMDEPGFRERLLQMNVDISTPQTPEQFKTFLAKEFDRWGKPIRASNIRAE